MEPSEAAIRLLNLPLPALRKFLDLPEKARAQVFKTQYLSLYDPSLSPDTQEAAESPDEARDSMAAAHWRLLKEPERTKIMELLTPGNRDDLQETMDLHGPM